MRLAFDFPQISIDKYHGPGNLDMTLEEGILDTILEALDKEGISANGPTFEFIPATPNQNDAFVRIWLSIDPARKPFPTQVIFQALQKEGYENGLTIRSENLEILFAHPDTPDIQYRRKLKNM